jgi:hypothetical protein
LLGNAPILMTALRDRDFYESPRFFVRKGVGGLEAILVVTERMLALRRDRYFLP